MLVRSKTDPILLISGVVTQRTDDLRAGRLTRRLHKGIVDAAGSSWRVITTWGETDGVAGALDKLSQADAVVIMGGPDLSPDLYGGDTKYPNAEKHFPRSDEAQLAIIEKSIGEGIPLLGICRGMQALNVVMGGTLHQDIGIPGHSNSTFLDDLLLEQHRVDLNENSRLAQILDPGTSGALQARSAHHQAVDVVGANLHIAATAPDGIIEAVEHDRAPVYGVQWHPEAIGSHPDHLRRVMDHMAEARSVLPVSTRNGVAA